MCQVKHSKGPYALRIETLLWQSVQPEEQLYKGGSVDCAENAECGKLNNFIFSLKCALQYRDTCV